MRLVKNTSIAICIRSSVPCVEDLQSWLHAIAVSTLLQLHPNYMIILLKLTPSSEAPVPLCFYVLLAAVTRWPEAENGHHSVLGAGTAGTDRQSSTLLYKPRTPLQHQFVQRLSQLGRKTIAGQLSSVRPKEPVPVL